MDGLLGLLNAVTDYDPFSTCQNIGLHNHTRSKAPFVQSIECRDHIVKPDGTGSSNFIFHHKLLGLYFGTLQHRSRLGGTHNWNIPISKIICDALNQRHLRTHNNQRNLFTECQIHNTAFTTLTFLQQRHRWISRHHQYSIHHTVLRETSSQCVFSTPRTNDENC